MPLPLAIRLASDLLSIHHHDELTGEIIYKDTELIPILQKHGLPLPDYEGNAKVHNEMIQRMHRAFLELHPGQLIEKYLDDAGWSPTYAASVLGVSEKELDRIMYKGAAVSKHLANRLEVLFSKPAQEWLDMQTKYDTELKRVFGHE